MHTCWKSRGGGTWCFLTKSPRGVKAFRKNCLEGGGSYFRFYCVFINKCFEICLKGVLYLPSPLTPLYASIKYMYKKYIWDWEIWFILFTIISDHIKRLPLKIKLTFFVFFLPAKWRQPPWRALTPLPRLPAWPWPRRRCGCCARRAWTPTGLCRPSAPGPTERTRRQTPRRRWDSTLSLICLLNGLKMGCKNRGILDMINLSRFFWHHTIEPTTSWWHFKDTVTLKTQ